MTSLSSLPTHYVQSLFNPNTATRSFTSTTTCKPHALHSIFLSSPFHEFRPVTSFPISLNKMRPLSPNSPKQDPTISY